MPVFVDSGLLPQGGGEPAIIVMGALEVSVTASGELPVRVTSCARVREAETIFCSSWGRTSSR